MALETLDQYRSQAESERAGLRGLIGKAMTFAGFIILANTFLLALLFRHVLSFRNQIVCALVGAVVGLIGMLVRGNTRSQLTTAALASSGAIAATVIVSFLEERFGLLILVGIVLVLAWLIQNFEKRAWKRL
jgi:Na+/H+-translocating membrane pyrophosphatase